LSNCIQAATSAFLYVVFTGCVLVDPTIEMDELFCDPFPGAAPVHGRSLVEANLGTCSPLLACFITVYTTIFLILLCEKLFCEAMKHIETRKHALAAAYRE